jgi:hypothetical protein
MQLERLRPHAYGRVRGIYIARRRRARSGPSPQTATIRSACAAAASLAKLSLIASVGARGAPDRHAPRWDRRRMMATATWLLYTVRVSVEGCSAVGSLRPGRPPTAGSTSTPGDSQVASATETGLHRRRRVPSFPALGDEGLEVPVATAAHHPEPRVAHPGHTDCG